MRNDQQATKDSDEIHRVSEDYVCAPHLQLLNRLFDLLNLDLAEAFDLEKSLASCGVNRLLSIVCQPGARVRTSLRILRKSMLTATV